MGIAERKEREREQKRNLILDCSEKLFFTKGYTGTSMDDIASEAEYSKGTMYTYFKSKDEILAHIYKRAVSLLYTMFKQYTSKKENGIDKLEQIGRANFDFMNKYQDYYTLMKMFDTMEIDRELIQETLMDIRVINNSIIGFMTQIIITGQKDGTVNKNLEPVSTAHILAATSSGIFQWIKNLKVEQHTDTGFDPVPFFN